MKRIVRVRSLITGSVGDSRGKMFNVKFGAHYDIDGVLYKTYKDKFAFITRVSSVEKRVITKDEDEAHKFVKKLLKQEKLIDN